MAAHDRRAQIYETAARIFFENGYAATSVDQIADAVGLLKGSLYYYMATKEDLLFHVIEEAHQKLSTLLDLDESAGGTPIEQLARLVTTHVTYICENPVSIGVFLNDFRFLSEDRRALIIARRDTYDARLRRIFESGVKDGSFSPKTQVKLTASGLLGMVNWVHQWYRPGGTLTPAEIAAEFVRFTLDGVATRHPAATKSAPTRAAPPRKKVSASAAKKVAARSRK